MFRLCQYIEFFSSFLLKFKLSASFSDDEDLGRYLDADVFF